MSPLKMYFLFKMRYHTAMLVCQGNISWNFLGDTMCSFQCRYVGHIECNVRDMELWLYIFYFQIILFFFGGGGEVGWFHHSGFWHWFPQHTHWTPQWPLPLLQHALHHPGIGDPPPGSVLPVMKMALLGWSQHVSLSLSIYIIYIYHISYILYIYPNIYCILYIYILASLLGSLLGHNCGIFQQSLAAECRYLACTVLSLFVSYLVRSGQYRSGGLWWC